MAQIDGNSTIIMVVSTLWASVRLILIFNPTQSVITWKRGLNEVLSRLG